MSSGGLTRLGSDFDICFLLQSFVVIACQLPILHLYHELTHPPTIPMYADPNTPVKTLGNSLLRFAPLFRTLLKYAIFFAGLLTLWLLYPDPLVVGAIGSFSSAIASVLPVPQLVNNFRKHSVEGLR